MTQDLAAHAAPCPPSLDLASDRVRVATTPDGPLDVRVCTPGGTWVRIQSLHAPDDEARGLVDRALGAGTVPPVVAIVGVGLGHTVDEVRRRRPDVRIVALEVVPELVPIWQMRADVSNAIASGHIVIGTDPAFEMPAVSWPGAVIGDDPLTIVHPAMAHYWPDAVERATRALRQYMFERRANEEARQRLAPMYFEHTLRNLPELVGATDVSALDGIAVGEPLVLCGAGPSLDRLLPELRACRDRVWFVALDTALRPLLAGGIVPDLVVSIDPTPLNGRHLLNLPTRQRPWLLAETSIDPRVLTAFDGRTFACRIGRAEPWPWLERLGVTPTRVRAWGSVLTTACDVVVRMRPARVACAAIDLAYTGGQPYCRGTVFEEDWEAQRVRDGLETTADVWRARLAAANAVTEPDVHGARVATAGHLIAFRNWVRQLASTADTCAFTNVTGAGILHGDRIEQSTVAAWIADAPPVQGSVSDRLKAAATLTWGRCRPQVADQCLEAIDDESRVRQEWREALPPVDAASVRRTLRQAVVRLRAGSGVRDMSMVESEWIDMAYDQATFLAREPATWQVDPSGVETLAYRLQGKTMTLSFKVNFSRLSHLSPELHLRLPGNVLAARGAANAVWLGSPTMKETGYATVHQGSDSLIIHRPSEQAFAPEDGYLFVFGQIVFEVQ